MRCFLVVLMTTVGIGCAQTNGKDPTKREEPQIGDAVVLCKLELVTWNPETEELSWVISMRDFSVGAAQTATQTKYTIHLDTAVMDANGEGRRFDTSEAQKVSALMDVIGAYTVESTVW